MPESKNSNPVQTRAARARQQVLGRELRRIYDSVVQEPVPDEFLELLKKMDEQDNEQDEEPCEKGSS